MLASPHVPDFIFQVRKSYLLSFFSEFNLYWLQRKKSSRQIHPVTRINRIQNHILYLKNTFLDPTSLVSVHS